NIALLLEKNHSTKIKKEDLISEKIKITQNNYPNIAREISFYIGMGIVNIINLFSPEVVIIGGKLLDFYDVINKEFYENLESHVYSSLKPKLIKASLGYESGIIGAVALSFEKLIQNPDSLINKCVETNK
ncbi:MAG: N-acetylglucosamine repressor, partial [Kosmotogales bacterium]|nr:N-acetylglucosamine repressor [Kosmotogales bacterium]